MLGRQATLEDTFNNSAPFEVAQFVSIKDLDLPMPFKTCLFLVPRGPPADRAEEHGEIFPDVPYGRVLLSPDRKKILLDWSLGILVEGQLYPDIENEVNALAGLAKDYAKDLWSIEKLEQPALHPAKRTFNKYLHYGAHMEFVWNNITWPDNLSSFARKLCSFAIFDCARVCLVEYQQELNARLDNIAELQPRYVKKVKEYINAPGEI